MVNGRGLLSLLEGEQVRIIGDEYFPDVPEE